MRSFLDILRDKVVVFDGAMGTNIQVQNPTADDFGGEAFNGCNEYLVVTKPSAIERIHADFLEAGCDVIETDTFGATSVVLAEYGLADRSYELNRRAAELARKVAADFSTPDRPRFVAGSLGPTTKLPSLGHIGFTELEEAYFIQAKGLVEGSADLLVVETCQDPLQAKAALAGIFRYFHDARSRIPVIASVTVETTGTMLLGTEMSAALTTFEVFPIDLIGINCATGPQEMSENVRYLSANSPLPVFVMPNAGIPQNVGGRAHYTLPPEEFARLLTHFAVDLGVSAIGGCCGTTPAHLKKLVEQAGSLAPRQRSWEFTPSVSSLYQTAPLHIEPAPVLIGERTNANGSKLFRDLLMKEEWEGMVTMGKEQSREGAHVLDVCAAFVGRDEVRDIREIATRFNTQISIPLMIDSTEPPVIEEALQRIAGKAIVNSVNLEDGGVRMAKVLAMCRKYGAAVVALTIDEQGMAKTVERKVEIARRIHQIATQDFGIKEANLLFDTLTFTLASGDEEYRRAGIETLEAIRAIKKEFPAVHTSLGVSNISFGLAPQARHVLNSVFLHHAIKSGLDLAIVNASKILPLYRISDAERELARRLVFDERLPNRDPLMEMLAFYAGRKPEKKTAARNVGTVEERLKERIIEGDKSGLAADLDKALGAHSPLDIINTILLEGMKVVGDLFGRGEMQLPFVLQSAEVMKSAVSYLEKFMDKAESTTKGTMVIATVKGDVHDIGKNLVDIILTNNGYRVINLGIQCPLDRMLTAAGEHSAQVIGMSGLLVKSTLIMKENLEIMNERGLTIPVVVGGAALTRRYVEEDLRRVYRGEVSYANDAFDGLRFMERITSGASPGGAFHAPLEDAGSASGPEDDEAALTGTEAKIAMASRETQPPPKAAVGPAEIPVPPFYGTKLVRTIDLDDVFQYINEVALIRGQWQVRRGKLSEADYRRVLQETVYPELKVLQDQVKRERLLEPMVVYGYFPCQSEGDALIVYAPRRAVDPSDLWPAAPAPRMDELREVLRFTFPRQRKDRYLCIADFFASRDSGRIDVLACQIVTVGSAATEHAKQLLAANRYKDYLYFHGISVESAEALAELWHKRVRQELGIGHHDAPEVKKLFSQHYRGSRYSFGYPACPRLEDQEKLADLLKQGRIGISLTEGYQLVPEQSTSAIIVHHPAARYFTI